MKHLSALALCAILSLVSIGSARGATLVGVPDDTSMDCGSLIPNPVSLTGVCGALPSDGLILHLPFNTNVSTLVTDSSGAGNHGTNYGAAECSGYIGAGMRFDGSDYIGFGTIPPVNNATSLSFGAWIKPSAWGTLGIMGNTVSENAGIAMHLNASGILTINIHHGEYFTILNTTNTLGTGAWHQVMCVFDGVRVRLYLNGLLNAESSDFPATSIRSNNVKFAVGDVATGRGWRFRGDLDDVRIYARALTGSEVFSLATGDGLLSPLTLQETTNGTCPRVVRRIWMATDSCGTVAATQTITLTDSTAPVLSGLPADLVLDCGMELPPPPPVSALDACAGPVDVTLTEWGTSGCPASVERIWSATDPCGNTVTGRQVISFQTLAPPTLLGVPPDTTTFLDDIPRAAVVTATGECSGAVSADQLVLLYDFDSSSEGSVADSSGAGNAGVNHGATWVADGVHGGAMHFNGNAWIGVGTFPAINGAPALSFGAWIKPSTLGTLGIFGKTLAGDETVALHVGISDKLVANVDRSGEFTALYTNQPIRTGVWQHVMCVYDGTQVSLYLDGQPIATSAVFAAAAISSNQVSAAVGDVAEGRGWRFRGLIDEMRVYRRALSKDEVSQLAQASTDHIPVMLTEVVTGDCPTVLSRTWTAQDRCGHQVSATQHITLVDIHAPQLFGVPGNRALTCGQTPPPAPLVSAFDNSGDHIPIVFEEVEGSGCPRAITRTWTATDACGNSTSATQYITFNLEQAVVLTGVPSDCSLPCGTIPPPPAVSLSGGCTGVVSDADLIVWYPFENITGALIPDASGSGHTGTNHGALVVGGLAGNGLFFDGNDALHLGTLPTINGATSLSFGAWIKPAALETLGIIGKTVSGNETIALHVGVGDKLVANVDRAGEFTVLVTTNRLRTNEWQHVMCVYNGQQVQLYLNGQLAAASELFDSAPISSNSIEAAVGDVAAGRGWYFKGVMDDVRIYTRPLSASEIAALVDAGGTTYTPVNMSETWNLDCPQTLTRVWSASDACGQFVAATQHITFLDTEAPVLAGIPADRTIACGDPIPLANSVTATDACAGAVSIMLNSTTNDGCPGTITRTWTALDACGNSTSAVQVISLHELAVTNGLHLQYLFDQPGLVAVDSSGSGYHGSMTQAFWQPMGSCGGALQSGQGWVTAGPVLDVGGTRTSLCVMVRLRSLQGTGEECIIGKTRDQLPLNGWSLRLDSYGRAVASLVGDYPEIASCVSEASLRDGRWHVIAATFRATQDQLQTELYVDGEPVSSGSYSGVHASVASEVPLLVGNLGPGLHAPFNGLLDEVRIYGRAPSREEIATHTTSMSACADPSRRIQVLLEPAALQQNGAAWQLSDDTNGWWYASGNEALIPATGGLVQFAEVPGWILPSPIALQSTADEFLVVTGRYVASAADAIPPTLVAVDPPHDSVVVSNSAVVTVTASDNAGVAWVTVNGLEASWIGSDDYRVQITGLRGLYNNVHLEVADISGNLVSSNINYRQATDLSLTALWDGKWELDNPYSDEVIFQWQIRGGIASSATNAPPRAKTRFNTPKGSFILDILVGGDVVLSEESSPYPPPPMGVSDGSLDSDLDGISNFDEDLAGTDINDATSLFEFGLSSDRPDTSERMLTPRSLAGGTLAIQPVFIFRSSTDHEYTLESSTDAQTWSTVLDFYRVPGTGGDLAYTNRVIASPTLLRIKANKKP